MVHVDVELEMFLTLAKLFSVRAGIADIKLSPLASLETLTVGQNSTVLTARFY